MGDEKLESIKSFEIGLGSKIVKNMVLDRLCKETYKNIDQGEGKRG